MVNGPGHNPGIIHSTSSAGNIIARIEENPIIAAVRKGEDLQEAVQSTATAIFLLHTDIFKAVEMIDFIKRHDLGIIKKKLIFLYLLNISDIIFTLMLLNTGYYIEANAVMAPVMRNPSAGFALKAALPAVLLLYLYFRLQNAVDSQLKISNILLNTITLFYILVNIMHLVCFAVLPLLQ
jgi:cell division protein FtsB